MLESLGSHAAGIFSRAVELQVIDSKQSQSRSPYERLIELLNREDVGRLSRGSPALKYGAIKVSGAYLMNHGLALPWSFPETMWVVKGARL